MKFYYAIFKKIPGAVEVEFPDLKGCVTFGENWDEAITNSTDVLAAWLANADKEFVNEPSTYHQIKKLKGDLVPIPIDENLLESYRESKRINIILPTDTLNRIDRYRKKAGMKRSTLLDRAAKEYLQKHP